MKNHLIFSLFIVSILTLCACTVESTSGQLAADVETPKKLAFGNLEHGLAADMVYVEGGTFQMGCNTSGDIRERPAHEVTVSSFYMCKYEVTQAKFEAIMRNNPSEFKGKRRPVEQVSWYDAVKYCNRRSEAEGLTPCYTIDGTNVTCNWSANGYRLPTEAEWEYAAKGGIHKSPHKYSGSDNIEDVAWYCKNSGSETYKVGKKAPNALGIYDMSGNVWEWCWDWYGDYSSTPAQDPLGPASGVCRVERGGDWDAYASSCQCDTRNGFMPNRKCKNVGFRVVRSAITTESTGGQLAADVETPKKLAFGNLEHGLAADMVYVEGGTFQMGCNTSEYKWEKPEHKVTVSSFYMGKYEVTQAEYEAIMRNNPSKFKGERLPVEQVSWYDAVKYCNKRSEAERLTPCYTIDGTDVMCNWSANGYRLPTEAEWEYAARGGIHKSPYKYSGSNNIKEVAWYCNNSGGKTYEVGKKAPNTLGIYDMSGNVYEWCWDWYGSRYCSNRAVSNPSGPASGVCRVIRGGGWCNNAVDCQCVNRSGTLPTDRSNGCGFRIVRSRK